MTVATLILAAGRSERMGQPKAWLQLGGRPLLQVVVRSARRAGADPIVVVVGADADPGLVSRRDVAARLEQEPVTIVVGRPDGTPIDSIRAGLAAVPPNTAVLLWPVDHPFADSTLVERMITSLERPDQIVLPVCGPRRGHPILIGPEAAAELTTPAADEGADQVVRRSEGRIVTVITDDTRIAATLNTPEDAAQLGVELAMPQGTNDVDIG